MAHKWQPKIDGLILLAEDQAGKPEGELAKEKLRRILCRFPELAMQHTPFGDYADRTFTLRDLRKMQRLNISTGGVWQGRNLDEAMAMMVADYKQRLNNHGVAFRGSEMKKRRFLKMQLPAFIKSAMRLVAKTTEVSSDKFGIFRLRPFERFSGSFYSYATLATLGAWGDYIPNEDYPKQELGAVIRMRVTQLHRGFLQVDLECHHVAFKGSFDGLVFVMSTDKQKIAILERELEALEARALEAG